MMSESLFSFQSLIDQSLLSYFSVPSYNSSPDPQQPFNQSALFLDPFNNNVSQNPTIFHNTSPSLPGRTISSPHAFHNPHSSKLSPTFNSSSYVVGNPDSINGASSDGLLLSPNAASTSVKSNVEFSEKSHSFLHLTNFTSYVPTSLESHLLTIFFCHLHGRFLPIFYEPLFFSRLFPVNQHPCFLIHAICGYAANFSTHPDLVVQADGIKGAGFIRKAEEELDAYKKATDESHLAPLEMAQTCLIITRAKFGFDLPSEAVGFLRK
jgi:hypothetical protein